MTVILQGYILVPEADLAVVREALPQHIANTRAELGCIQFRVESSPEEVGRFDVYEEFVDQQAFEFHQARVRESHWGHVTSQVERHYSVSG